MPTGSRSSPTAGCSAASSAPTPARSPAIARSTSSIARSQSPTCRARRTTSSGASSCGGTWSRIGLAGSLLASRLGAIMTSSCHPTRRAALALGLAAAGSIAMHAHAADEPADPKTPWIDAHSHIWSPDVARWPLAEGKTKADLAPASFTDDELLAIARPEGVGRVVLIQHSLYHLFDNRYLLDAARRRPKLFRVVAMVDDRQPGAGEEMKRLLPLGATGFRITPFLTKAQGA